MALMVLHRSGPGPSWHRYRDYLCPDVLCGKPASELHHAHLPRSCYIEDLVEEGQFDFPVHCWDWGLSRKGVAEWIADGRLILCPDCERAHTAQRAFAALGR